MNRILPCLGLLALTAPLAHAQVDPEHLAAMTARSIGPAGMSGRVASIDAVVADPRMIYVGSATGGLWKSRDGGLTWTPIFDRQGTSSIGAVAVFQPNPDIVWVGTGEGNPRNSAGVGNGIYKSIDGGRTWSHLGLERSERIHRVVPHPTNSDVAYLAVLGPTWSDGEERGVYKTTDGGRTWQRVLHTNARTGAADLVMDPRNPNKLFAALWEHRREPWFFTSGGPGSGLYVTYDGGEHWRRLTADDGLPAGDLGRIGLAVAQSDPSVVYALVEASPSALLRSADGGHTWRTVSTARGIAPRPFYYADIRVDPVNENRVYNLHGRIQVSEDGGKTWRLVVPSATIHGDVHELWIHPLDGRLLLMGNDGGVGISYDRGGAWRFIENLPLAQFYHLNVDMDTPFNVYGGMQDNGSWMGPSALWRLGGIRNYYWHRVGSGDGFATLHDVSDPRYGYSMSQRGNLRRFDLVTGVRKDIQPVHPDGTELRFHWNAAIAADPFDSATIFFGSQFVHRTRDHGDTWELISPDLTTNDPAKQRQRESGGLTMDVTGAENHTTILTIAPSPVERGVIWVGTDDGNLQLTRDGGETWTNVADRIRGVPAATWIPHIEPSRYEGATAFVVWDDHRRGNWTPYVFQTTDYGRSWRSLATDEIRGFVHVIEQDPVEPDLLYLGTEFGLYLSLDRGRRWMKWTHGLPTVPVRALVVHPRDHDLAIGTHGRGAFVLDDVRPLRALAERGGRPPERLVLFDPPPAYEHQVADAVGYRSTGHAMFFGENRPYGVLLSYWIPQGVDSVELTMTDADGDVVRTLRARATAGLNRTTWDLRAEAFEGPAASGGTNPVRGPDVPPGRYTVRVRAGGAEVSGEVEVRPDPRTEIPAGERVAKYQAIRDAGQRLEVATEAVRRLRRASEGVNQVLASLEARSDSQAAALREAAPALLDTLAAVTAVFVDPPRGQRDPVPPPTVSDRFRGLLFSLYSSWDVPTATQRVRRAQADQTLASALDRANRVMSENVGAFRQVAASAGFVWMWDTPAVGTDRTRHP